MRAHTILTSAFLLLSLSSLSSPVLSAPSERRSTLWPGDSIAVEDASGDLLVSPMGNFSCGFYKVATNAYTFAIWFTHSADATVAWTANRDAPVNGRGSRAAFRKDGSLALQDFDGRVVWRTNTSGTQADRAQLLDAGNLVVSDAAGNTLWQSFHWPTDTLLPDQPITRYKRLVSASAKGLPYSGYYNLYFDSNNILNLIYDGPEISSNYWPDPFKQWWENNRTAFNSSRYGSLDTHGRFTASDHTQFNASDMEAGGGVMRRLTLDYDGNLRLYSLDGGGRWRVTWVALPRQCDVHGVCGRYGVCAYLPELACSCPDGFVAADAGDWSKGCRREFDVRCGEPVYFAEMRSFDFWGVRLQLYPGRHMGTGECYPKISLWNGLAPNILKQNIFLKVPARVKSLNLNPAALDFHGHACTVHEQNASVSASYFHARRNKINFAYFYSFLAAAFVVESIFIVVGYVFVFRADPAAAGRRVLLRDEEGYALLCSHFRRFTYDELSDVTGKFTDKLGRGASGTVYKGVLEDGRSVAVKRLDDLTQADEVFRSEMSVIGRINHMNLVRMWGFCSEHSHRILVSEFVENGSLDKALFGGAGAGGSELGWRSRCKVAVGVAKGLAYLHHECLEWIVHCDVKPENILLDAELDPKITDFGLVKLLSRRDACGRLVLSRAAQGGTSRGYVAPEWAMGLPITGKADVFSFGVVLLELIRGERVCDWVVVGGGEEEKGVRMDFQRLVGWLREKMMERDDERSSWMEGEFVDPRLRGDFSHLQAAVMMELAVACVDEDPNRRPSMNAVLQKLLSLEDAAPVRGYA
ncbi:unnamed protein product [Urochloa decumbens]|uniref:Receptor-like serine/threonine-protein kinase n=1 Tax=Urochloa decumbens TaxID=240449 RepID=A0ABC9CRS1_9POAL